MFSGTPTPSQTPGPKAYCSPGMGALLSQWAGSLCSGPSLSLPPGLRVPLIISFSPVWPGPGNFLPNVERWFPGLSRFFGFLLSRMSEFLFPRAEAEGLVLQSGHFYVKCLQRPLCRREGIGVCVSCGGSRKGEGLT